MKDIYEVIRQKESDLERIQRELDALRLSARLLEDASRSNVTSSRPNPVPAAAPVPTPTASERPAGTANAWATAKQFP